MSLGEDRVRINFNPPSNSRVLQIKQKSAELIDLCQEMWVEAANDPKGDEKARLVRLAQTHYEDAAMWATKAATA